MRFYRMLPSWKKRSLICFLGPFLLLFLSFIALYFSRIVYGTDSELAKKSITLMELFWAYFPTIGACASAGFVEILPKENRNPSGKNFLRKRFFLCHLPLLVGLWLLTLWNIRVRFLGLASSYLPELLLEIEWIGLQALSIALWMRDNKGRELERKTTLRYFLIPLFFLFLFAVIANCSKLIGWGFAFQCSELIENSLFVYFPGMQACVWMRKNWST